MSEERVWTQNVESGQVRTIAAGELEGLQPPWKQISADEAVRAHARSVQ